MTDADEDAVIIQGDPRSAYLRTARLVCEEKGIVHRVEPFGPPGTDLSSIAPLGKIPGFRHGRFQLYETLAIAMYLETAFPDPPLLPADARARGVAFQWIGSATDYFYDAMIGGYVLEHLGPRAADGSLDRTVIDANVPRIGHQLAVLDRTLQSSRWLAGFTLSLADLFVAPLVAYVAAMPDGLLDPHPNVVRFLSEMRARPSWARSAPPDGSGLV